MDKYNIKLNPQAYRDLEEIFAYTALKKLDTFPQSHQERMEGHYTARGYRQLLIDNYMTIFRIDEKTKTVHILTIQYQGRNI